MATSREIKDRSRNRAHHTPGLPSASLPPIAELIIRFTWDRCRIPHIIINRQSSCRLNPSNENNICSATTSCRAHPVLGTSQVPQLSARLMSAYACWMSGRDGRIYGARPATLA